MFAQSPLRWEFRDFGSGNHGLLALGERTMHVIAAPGNRVMPGDHDSQIAGWRHATWSTEADDEPVVSLDPPLSITPMRAAEVLTLLPDQQHDYVRSALAEQLRLACLHGSADPDCAPGDRHAQLAGRARAHATAELAEAFPGESWHLEDDLSFEVPPTAAELLRRIPASEAPPDPEPHEQLWQAKFQPHRGYLMHIVSSAENKPRIAAHCYYALEKVRYSIALRILRTHERDQLSEVTEYRRLIEESGGEIPSARGG